MNVVALTLSVVALPTRTYPFNAIFQLKSGLAGKTLILRGNRCKICIWSMQLLKASITVTRWILILFIHWFLTQPTSLPSCTSAPYFTARRYASAVYGMSLWLSACLSVTSLCSGEKAEWIEQLVFGTEATLDLPIHCVGSSVSPKNGTSLCKFIPNFELCRFLCFFRPGTSMIAVVVNLLRPTSVLSLSHWASHFLPRDAMLARYMLSSCVRPSVRLSFRPS